MKKEIVTMSKIIILSFAEDEEDVYKGILNIIENMSCLERYNNLENRTNMKFEILSLLANNPGRVFSKEQIYNLVWRQPYYGDYNIVMSHIHNIREKIEDNPREPVYIQTVWGAEYRFNRNLESN